MGNRADRGDTAPPSWEQSGGFSVFFDRARPDAGPTGERWRVRVYHEETGDDVVLEGPSAASWHRWVIARLDVPTGDQDEPPRVHRLTVEIVDARSTPKTYEDDTVQVETTVRVDGLTPLLGDLGATVLRHALSRTAV